MSLDAKLKVLKVSELKDILTKASINVPGKTNKADLIGLVSSNQAALDVYNQIYNPAKESPADASQPQVVTKPDVVVEPQTSVEGSASNPVSPSIPSTNDAPAPLPSTTTVEPFTAPASEAQNASPDAPLDPDEEKKRQRAARFGIPYVPPQAPPPLKGGRKGKKVAPAAPNEGSEKLKARAARFGIPTSETPAANDKKRPAPTEEAVDSEEQERRRKRLERFGQTSAPTTT